MEAKNRVCFKEEEMVTSAKSYREVKLERTENCHCIWQAEVIVTDLMKVISANEKNMIGVS